DVTLRDIRIINYQISRFGVPAEADTMQPIEYRIFLADFREQFIEPRGGRVMNGLINTDGSASGVFYLNAALMQFCLDRMGISYNAPPSDVNAVEPPHNLKWLGNHAPTELAGLLDHAGAVFCPLMNGSGKIEMKGQGDVPEFAPASIAEDRPAGGIDQRG